MAPPENVYTNPLFSSQALSQRLAAGIAPEGRLGYVCGLFRLRLATLRRTDS